MVRKEHEERQKRNERGNRGVRNRGYGERETSKVEERDTGKLESQNMKRKTKENRNKWKRGSSRDAERINQIKKGKEKQNRRQ